MRAAAQSVASSAASDQADGGLGVCVAQWSGVAGNDWQTTVFGRNIRTEAELFELEEQWDGLYKAYGSDRAWGNFHDWVQKEGAEDNQMMVTRLAKRSPGAAQHRSQTFCWLSTAPC